MRGLSTDSKTIENYEMRLGRIGDADRDQLHALSISVGWPHRAEDWDVLRHIGDGFVAFDEINRVAGSIMWFPYSQGFAHLGMLMTSPRLQSSGAGRWLMQHALSELEGRSLALVSTRASRRLLHHDGFLPEHVVYQCQGTARSTETFHEIPKDLALKTLTKDDLAGVVELDAQAFGTNRQMMIVELFAQSTGIGLFRNGTLCAFSLCRRFGRGHVIGPIVATADEEAIVLCEPHVAQHTGQFLRVDTPLSAGPFVEFLSEVGMAVRDTVLVMNKGLSAAETPRNRLRNIVHYSLASQALG